MRTHYALAKIKIREDLRYFWTDALPAAGLTLVFALIITTFYSAVGASIFFGIFTWSALVWYLFITQILQHGQTRLVTTISDQIQNGEIVSRLTKPYSYPLALFSEHFSEVITNFLLVSIVMLPFAFFITGAVPLTTLGVISTLVILLLATIIDYCISLSVGLIAFWTENSRPYWWIYQKLVFLAGGLIFPLDALGSTWANIAKSLPPAFLLYYPARLSVDYSQELFTKALIGGLIYVVITVTISWLVWKAASRKVFIHGG